MSGKAHQIQPRRPQRLRKREIRLRIQRMHAMLQTLPARHSTSRHDHHTAAFRLRDHLHILFNRRFRSKKRYFFRRSRVARRIHQPKRSDATQHRVDQRIPQKHRRHIAGHFAVWVVVGLEIVVTVRQLDGWIEAVGIGENRRDGIEDGRAEAERGGYHAVDETEAVGEPFGCGWSRKETKTHMWSDENWFEQGSKRQR